MKFVKLQCVTRPIIRSFRKLFPKSFIQLALKLNLTTIQGAFIVSGCADGSVLVFDMEKGKAVNKLQGHSWWVHSVESYYSY